MKPAKRLKRVGIWFKGPHSAALFKALHTPEKYCEFDHVVIGTGESRAVAASRAISHMRDLNIRPILEDIQTHVQVQLPPHASDIEAGGLTSIYCIIALDVEREDD